MAGSTGIEPAAYGLRDRNLRFPSFPQDIDWNGFKRFLDKNHSVKASKDIVYYARKYDSCLVKYDFSELNEFPIAKKRHTLAAPVLHCAIEDDFTRQITALIDIGSRFQKGKGGGT